jgi:hypothetical protein
VPVADRRRAGRMRTRMPPVRVDGVGFCAGEEAGFGAVPLRGAAAGPVADRRRAGGDADADAAGAHGSHPVPVLTRPKDWQTRQGL